MHREDIKAQIRKVHGTVGAFEVAQDLKNGSVNDVLRGRASAPTEAAIAKLLKQPLHKLFPRRYAEPKNRAKSCASKDATSSYPDDSTQKRTRHRQTAGGC